MNVIIRSILQTFILAVLTTAAAYAHHSFQAEYDADKPVTVKGTIVKVEWENPHIHFYLDVAGENGSVDHWKFEGFPPNMLVRQGWKRDETLRPGDMVTVYGWQARNGARMAHSREVTFADGKKMFSGPPTGF